LNKIIERNDATAVPQSSAPSYEGAAYQGQRVYGDWDERYDPRRKKKSILGEPFDF
jgi:Zn-finger nucleic acid-binding protein